MGADRDYVTTMLARQVLGIDDYSKSAHLPPAEISEAQAEVEINLRSMVRGMRQRIWLDSAAIATRVQEALERACSEASIDRVIHEAVREEIQSARQEIRDRVRKEIDRIIKEEISARLGDRPRMLAQQIARDMVDRYWDRVLEKKGAP